MKALLAMKINVDNRIRLTMEGDKYSSLPSDEQGGCVGLFGAIHHQKKEALG